MTNELERQIIGMVARDRINRPISSMSGKLKRRIPKLAKAVEISPGEEYDGERVSARVEKEDSVYAARKMSEAVDIFAADYPRHGKILKGLIEETRAGSETHFYFGLNDGCRLTADDYLGVMTDMGFTEATARRLYPELMNVSRKMARKKNDTERSVLIG
tara:strand:+ start:63 stop:542 length:480 start_codon:yes stop_codon:yes gene_type:complete